MKRLIMAAFEINGVNLTSQGLWAHPEQNTFRYKEIGYWIELAQLLERGRFDLLFLADSYGYPTIDGRTPDVAFEQAVEIPKNDPMLLIPALATATSGLGFAVTTSTTFEQPFANARRFATLDHITGGRVAWNVVTTSSAVVSELFGRSFVPHEERYAMAQDFLDLSYQLFEASWEDGSVVSDKERRLYARPELIHAIHHDGPYYQCHGYFNCEPSPQRTPLLLQAGASSTGRAFAATNAEVSFLQGKDAAALKAQVLDLRERAVAEGRAADAIKGISGLTVVVGESRSEAEDKLDGYLSYVNADAARVYYASMTGIDLAALDPNASFSSVQTEGGRTQVERYKDLKVAEAAADFIRHGMREFILTGTPVDVADQIEALVAETDLDGFNLTPFVSPVDYREFVDLVVPELQRRGLLQREYGEGVLRQRLFPEGDGRLPTSHRAARYRRGAAEAVTVG